jgi:single-strand DNA-binding protein
MNVLIATGNIGKDAELRYTAGEKPIAVCKFSFALTSGYGEKAVTSWLNCSLYGKRAETLTPMLTKGTKIAIKGEFTLREWADKSGVTKLTPELNADDITLLGKKDDSKPNQSVKQKTVDPIGFENIDDDIPF